MADFCEEKEPPSRYLEEIQVWILILRLSPMGCVVGLIRQTTAVAGLKLLCWVGERVTVVCTDHTGGSFLLMV